MTCEITLTEEQCEQVVASHGGGAEVVNSEAFRHLGDVLRADEAFEKVRVEREEAKLQPLKDEVTRLEGADDHDPEFGEPFSPLNYHRLLKAREAAKESLTLAVNRIDQFSLARAQRAVELYEQLKNM